MQAKTSTNIIIFQDAKSPYWMCQYTGPDGLRRKKTTKVPILGGLYQGEKLSKSQAKNRALIVAHAIAQQTDEDHKDHNNMTVDELFKLMLDGKLGRVSEKTYNNVQASYRFFSEWLGRRALMPLREVTKADIKSWVIHRRSLVRSATCRKDLTAIRSAFEWAVDAEIIDRNPCDKVSVPQDNKDEKIAHEAFTLDEISLLLAKLLDSLAADCKRSPSAFANFSETERHSPFSGWDTPAATFLSVLTLFIINYPSAVALPAPT